MGKSHQARHLNEDEETERTFPINFAEVRQMHFRQLQVRLVEHAVAMYLTRNETQYWENDLVAILPQPR